MMLRRACLVLLVVTGLCWTTPVWADDANKDDIAIEPSPGIRVLGVAASFVPGLLLHGAGHFAIGRRRTAYRLLLVEAIGVSMVFLAGIPIVFTAANRYVTREAAVVGALGVGLFTITLQADLWGTIVPLDSRGEAERTTPYAEVELGYRYVDNPRFQYSSFLVNAVDLRLGGLRLRPSVWTALDDSNRRTRVLGGYRFFGPRPGEAPAPDGTYFELQTAVTHHAHHPERFDTLTAEVFATGRLDMQHVDPFLHGSFAELGAGIGLQRFDYDSAPSEDFESLLLVRMGFGFYLGGPTAPVGEVMSYYDHRHDDFVGGFTEASIGVPGHIGFSGKAFLHDNVGVSAIFEVGAALMGGGSLLFRDKP